MNGLSEALAAAVARAGAWTVRVNARARLAASGVVWADGVVVAADHTIERDEDIGVTLPDSSTLTATLAGRDPGSDLAVLRVEAPGLAPATRAGEVRVGSLVLAIGRPGTGEQGPSASLGIVSAAGGAWRTRRRGTVAGFIRPDLTMYPGFSGGPLVDISGAMIGVNTSAFGGAPLTLPVAAAAPIVDQLLAHGRLKRGYLGLTSQPVRLPEAMAAAIGQETGLLVVGVEEESPAARGGILIGDILIAIDGSPLRDTEDLRGALGAERAGQQVTARIARGGQPRDVDLTIGER